MQGLKALEPLGAGNSSSSDSSAPGTWDVHPGHLIRLNFAVQALTPVNEGV